MARVTPQRHRISWGVALVAAASLLGACNDRGTTVAPDGSNYPIPSNLNDGLGGNHPASVDMDVALLSEMAREVREGERPNIHSILVYRRGQLVLEEYFSGTMLSDGTYRDFSRDTLHDIFSVSKSIVSAAVGLAIASGAIESLDQAVMDFFPEYRPQVGGSLDLLTIRHLLSMTAGLEWDESSSSYFDADNSHRRMMDARDPIEYVLTRPVLHPPGTVFTYSTGLSSLLGELIARATGDRYSEFLGRSLFDPLGIERAAWLPFYQDNVESAGGGLQLRPRDMTKFGVLYLNRGEWQGTNILSSAWVDESTTAQAPGGFYGYQWWLGIGGIGQTNRAFFRAAGLAGQHIYIYPDLDLVAVFTGNGSGGGPHELWLDYIIASVL
ncbi:MAG: serine hydrolase [Gemmatimonadota bacterium]|nr:serine hydrolase [Gemmatimonadota bacterium]